MKVYFVGSIVGKKKFGDNYKKIVKAIEKTGSKLFENTLNPSEEYVYGLSEKDKMNYYKQLIRWINAADVVVVEASQQSTSLGHEITVALDKGKPVIALYTKGNDPHLLQGLTSDKMLLAEYDIDDIDFLIRDLFEDAQDQMDVRFNFFVSPKIVNYLDWIAKKKRMPRAVYLRRLIDQDMDKNKEYSQGE